MLCLLNRQKEGATLKLIATDLDGTLLNSRKEISKENITAIKYAESKGIKVIIATGRSYFDAHSISKRAGISTYIIGSNGASIHTPLGEQISSAPMDKEDVQDIIHCLEDYNFYYEVYTNKGIYTFPDKKEILHFELTKASPGNPQLDISLLQKDLETLSAQFGYFSVDNYRNIFERDEKYYKIFTLSFDEAKRKAGIDYFINMPHLSLVSSGDYNFEISSQHASKGNSLEKLSSILDISPEDVMAIGDSYNDVSMLKTAGYSVAMGNANDDIKGICDIITDTNDQNGVADAIYRFVDLYKNVG